MKLFRRPNGYWYIRFQRGKEKSTLTKNQAEARRIFNAAKIKYLQGEVFGLQEKGSPTVAQYTAIYIKTRETERKADKTLEADKRALDYFVESTDNKMLSELTIKDLNYFVLFCRDNNVDIRNTSLNSYLRHIRTFLNSAHEHGYIKKKITVKMLKEPKRLPRPLSEAEQAAIVAHAHAYPGMGEIIIFTLNTGARLGDIDRADFRDIVDTANGKAIRFIGKGNKERKVPLNETALSALPSPLPAKGKIFTRSYDNITKTFKKIAKGCSIDDVHFHNLRATAATAAALSSMTTWEMMYIFGWEDISTALFYVNIAKSATESKMVNLSPEIQ